MATRGAVDQRQCAVAAQRDPAAMHDAQQAVADGAAADARRRDATSAPVQWRGRSPMSTSVGITPQGPVPAINVPNTQDYPRLALTSPYFSTVPFAELLQPSVNEAVEAILPSLIPPYVQDAAETAVSQLAVLL